jgi:hypothetical protein
MGPAADNAGLLASPVPAGASRGPPSAALFEEEPAVAAFPQRLRVTAYVAANTRHGVTCILADSVGDDRVRAVL